MNEQDRQQLEELKSSVDCLKNFACIKNKFKNLCSAELNKESNELVCREDKTDPCKFAMPRDEMLFCTCDLRIFIETNLDQWIASSASY